MKKLLGLIVIFLLFCLLLQGVRRNSNIASFFKNQVNENLIQENYKIAKEEKGVSPDDIRSLYSRNLLFTSSISVVGIFGS